MSEVLDIVGIAFFYVLAITAGVGLLDIAGIGIGRVLGWFDAKFADRALKRRQ